MNAEITISIAYDAPGKIAAYFNFPGMQEESAMIYKCGNIWHPQSHKLTAKAAAWIYAANKAGLTASEIRRLRKYGKISFPASVESMRCWWKSERAHRNGMTLRKAPNLQNV